MTSSYKELKEQAEKLLAEAEKARQLEVRQAIAQIKSEMAVYGITLQDLRQAGIADTRQAPRGTTTQPKYRGPNGELWGGGRGRKPDWVLSVLKAGGDIEKYRIQPH